MFPSVFIIILNYRMCDQVRDCRSTNIHVYLPWLYRFKRF